MESDCRTRGGSSWRQSGQLPAYCTHHSRSRTLLQPLYLAHWGVGRRIFARYWGRRACPQQHSMGRLQEPGPPHGRASTWLSTVPYFVSGTRRSVAHCGRLVNRAVQAVYSALAVCCPHSPFPPSPPSALRNQRNPCGAGHHPLSSREMESPGRWHSPEGRHPGGHGPDPKERPPKEPAFQRTDLIGSGPLGQPIGRRVDHPTSFKTGGYPLLTSCTAMCIIEAAAAKKGLGLLF